MYLAEGGERLYTQTPSSGIGVGVPPPLASQELESKASASTTLLCQKNRNQYIQRGRVLTQCDIKR